MKTKSVIGKKIIEIRQERTKTNYGDTVFNVKSIRLEDGTLIILSVAELEGDYAVDGTVYPPKK